MDCILTLNVGSSSLKFALFDIEAGGGLRLASRGQVEGIGTHPHLKAFIADDGSKVDSKGDLEERNSHDAAIQCVLRFLDLHLDDRHVSAVGHRIVHGGGRYDEPEDISDDLVASLQEFVPLAPLHQPNNLAGIAAARLHFPDAHQVACFDTAFHHHHDWVATAFALPRRLYDEGIRRYGFHGLSYEYILSEIRRTEPYIANGRLIVAHLGNGASMCAVKNGRSIDSTMGFSALDGLPMGTRCGSIDPGVLLHLMSARSMTAAEISDLLYLRSGLKGLSDLSSDVRELEESDCPEAAQALEYFAYRARREIGSLAAALSGLDAIIFCGGIGEHAAGVRARICDGLGWLGVELDEARNAAGAPTISSPTSRILVRVVETDEEAVVARHVQRRLKTRRAESALLL